MHELVKLYSLTCLKIMKKVKVLCVTIEKRRIMARILIVLTNIEKYQTTNRATGLWLGEATHFYEVITAAGHQADFISPNGGYVPLDPHSFKYANDIDWKHYNDFDFQRRALANSLTPEQIIASNYKAIYFTGGHGVIWDFPQATQISNIAELIYQNGGIISSVCHGACGLLNILIDGSYLISGKTVTGFTNVEEKLNRTAKYVPFSTEDELKKRNANYVKQRAFSEHVVVDGRIVTGQNPQSAELVAKRLIKLL